MFENFRERLQTVQQDFTSGIKTLSDKTKETKVKKKQRDEHFPQYSAGVELLSRYEDTWVALHKRAKECANAGETVDGEVVMLCAHWEKRRGAVLELQEELQQIPAFLSDLETITSRIAHLEADFEEMDSRLLYLEDLCAQCEHQRFKHFQILQLENHKKKKRKELESFKAELDAEHAQKVLEMEHVQQVKLKERQKYFEEAFQQDMEQYLSTGYLQITDRRGHLLCPMLLCSCVSVFIVLCCEICLYIPELNLLFDPLGSMSSMEVNVDLLEQMDLTDVSDHEALDVFLSSVGEESSARSPDTAGGPALEPGSSPSEISLKVPSQTELRPTVSSISSSCTDTISGVTEGPDEEDASEESCSGDSPLVQSDEEEVHADTALMGLPETEPLKSSDDSDTQAP
ncbi:dysbindin-A-like isoform X2 [Cyprinus carpio]|uniref:Dysbindin-A-like isoform X2 n=1 Tax=Cyprinus carpio TaxID=7962 RepID=A0A9R0BC75_CYPCA|nr:dysbindin-A-like isoform X2 [Cyprinus carpio]